MHVLNNFLFHVCMQVYLFRIVCMCMYVCMYVCKKEIISFLNCRGIVKMICELLLSKSDGKYVLLKDPNKPIVRLYKVPLSTFEVRVSP